MTEKLILIVNPAAGGGRCASIWPRWARRLDAAGLSFSVSFTTKPGEATRLVSDALRAGASVVVAVGGDGTASEVANGFFDGETLINASARFGVLPAGTGSDLARTLGLRGSAAVEALGPRGRTGRIDLGRVCYAAGDGRSSWRYFVNGGDLGLGGETAALAQRGTKALGGLAGYFLAAIRAILAHQPRTVNFAIDDGPMVDGTLDMIFVTNGRYTGGGMLIAPAASIDDGALDVIVLRAVSKVDLLFRLLPSIYRGAHLRHPSVEHVQAHRVVVQTNERLLLEVDGESLGTAPAQFSILPGALPIVLPP